MTHTSKFTTIMNGQNHPEERGATKRWYWHCRFLRLWGRRPAISVAQLLQYSWFNCSLFVRDVVSKSWHTRLSQICSEECSSIERHSKESYIAEQSNEPIIETVAAKMNQYHNNPLILSQTKRPMPNRPSILEFKAPKSGSKGQTDRYYDGLGQSELFRLQWLNEACISFLVCARFTL